jgi:DNA recombination protein RmuC
LELDALHFVLALLALALGALALVRFQVSAPRIAALETALESERSERRREAGQAEALQARLQAETVAMRARLETAERDLSAREAAAREREAALVRENEQLDRRQAQAEERFQALADAALRRSQETFIKVADETFKKHKEGTQGEIGALLAPIQESFGRFREKVEAIEQVRSEDRAALVEQIRQVADGLLQTQAVAGRLASALAAPRGGGRWGEETLRNVLELAGLSAYADFIEQAESEAEGGRIRPDVIVRMPGGRQLVIDSKVSLDDYLAASEEDDPTRRRQRLVAHAQRVKAHVARLARKDYWKDISQAVDFVAMFIPGENFFAAVLEHDRDIFEYAARNSVIIVTPSTLVALAKSVAYGWRQEQQAQNAEKAVELGQELYTRLAKMCEHMNKTGDGLNRAIGAYNDMIGSFERKVMPAARRFEDLKLAPPGRTLDIGDQNDQVARSLLIPEIRTSLPPDGQPPSPEGQS